MIKRTMTLTTLHGETDEAARREWWADNQAKMKANAERGGMPFEPQELECDVIAVFKGDDCKLELDLKHWPDVRGLKTGMTVTLTLEET